MFENYDIFSDPTQYESEQRGWDDEDYEEYEEDYIPDWDL